SHRPAGDNGMVVLTSLPDIVPASPTLVREPFPSPRLDLPYAPTIDPGRTASPVQVETWLPSPLTGLPIDMPDVRSSYGRRDPVSIRHSSRYENGTPLAHA